MDHYHNYRMGVDLAQNYPKSYSVQQLLRRTSDGSWESIGIVSKNMSLMGNTKATKQMSPDDWVKKNKYAIVTIMCKTIASDLRKRHDDLYVEAHPGRSSNTARLSIRRLATDEGIQVNLAPTGGRQFGFGGNILPYDDNSYTANAVLTRNGNKCARRKNLTETPKCHTFLLNDPQGTISFEKWVETIVMEWFYAEPQSEPEV